ncbi:MAG: DUF2764 family protein [Lentisphaeria bacterium]|nr:DUF2764 family protein [Lentisphaeria bacterium]
MSGANYYYFCSQLPTLIPGVPAPMTLEEFDRKLTFLPDADAGYIASCTFPPDRSAAFPAGSAAADFQAFEFALRGEIALLRLAKRPVEDAGKYILPPETGSIPGLRESVAGAASAPDPWERELRVDQIRWQKLDAIERGNGFSREAVACYRLKLAILQKEQSFRPEVGKTNFEDAAGQIDRMSAE